MQKFLAESRNGQKVFTDEENTNIGLHLIENPELLDLVEEVVRASEISGDNVGIEYDFGEIVGKTSCVKTTEKDQIVYAKRKQRDSFSRFVKNRQLEDTNLVSAVFFKKEYGYLLWSAWCGALVPTSPDSEGRMKTSDGFWQNHALVYDPDIIEPGTEQSSRPPQKQI
jgi:hypothetical protein